MSLQVLVGPSSTFSFFLFFAAKFFFFFWDFRSQINVFRPDERSDSLVVENRLGESSPAAWGAIAHGRQVRVEPVPPVDLQMLGQMVGSGKAFLADLAPGKVVNGNGGG